MISMLPDETLFERLRDSEDAFTERKQQGVSTEDACKTLVAFANSLPVGREGVLFIGISDKGGYDGVANPDKMQKDARRWAEQRCYPPISIQSRVISVSGVNILAIVVFSSNNRPHFAGPAFLRIGSESVNASAQMFEELITSRSDKGRQLLQYRDNDTVVLIELPVIYSRTDVMRFQCKVKECNPHYATFAEVVGGNVHSINLENMGIKWEGQMNMPLVVEYRS